MYMVAAGLLFKYLGGQVVARKPCLKQMLLTSISLYFELQYSDLKN